MAVGSGDGVGEGIRVGVGCNVPGGWLTIVVAVGLSGDSVSTGGASVGTTISTGVLPPPVCGAGRAVGSGVVTRAIICSGKRPRIDPGSASTTRGKANQLMVAAPRTKMRSVIATLILRYIFSFYINLIPDLNDWEVGVGHKLM